MIVQEYITTNYSYYFTIFCVYKVLYGDIMHYAYAVLTAFNKKHPVSQWNRKTLGMQ
jgi:hypothetical protein